LKKVKIIKEKNKEVLNRILFIIRSNGYVYSLLPNKAVSHLTMRTFEMQQYRFGKF